jgi:hypothetical protein
MDWSSVNCRTDCGRCNHKGVQSSMKGSKQCLINRSEVRVPDIGPSVYDRVISILRLKGIMRALGKNKEKE